MRSWEHLFPRAGEAEWRDWRWQQRNAVRTLADLERLVPLTDAERRGCEETAGTFRLGISPYYLNLIDRAHPFCPERMQAIPTAAEARKSPRRLPDPLAGGHPRPGRR